MAPTSRSSSWISLVATFCLLRSTLAAASASHAEMTSSRPSTCSSTWSIIKTYHGPTLARNTTPLTWSSLTSCLSGYRKSTHASSSRWFLMTYTIASRKCSVWSSTKNRPTTTSFRTYRTALWKLTKHWLLRPLPVPSTSTKTSLMLLSRQWRTRANRSVMHRSPRTSLSGIAQSPIVSRTRSSLRKTSYMMLLRSTWASAEVSFPSTFLSKAVISASKAQIVTKVEAMIALKTE